MAQLSLIVAYESSLLGNSYKITGLVWQKPKENVEQRAHVSSIRLISLFCVSGNERMLHMLIGKNGRNYWRTAWDLCENMHTNLLNTLM